MKHIKLKTIILWTAFFIALVILGTQVGNNYYLDFIITIFFMASMASAWNLVGGYAGLISIGHVAFMGLGAYTSSILFVKLGISPLIGIFLGGGVAMLLAFLIGMLTIRLRGPFFTLSTIAIAEILMLLAIRFVGLTGGSQGLDIPYKPSVYNFVFKSYYVYYVIFLVLLAIIIMVVSYINNSKTGCYLKAIREDETAAAALGVSILKYKMIALLISAFFTGVGGSIYAQYLLFIDPHSVFTVGFSTKVAALSIIGGIGTVLGPIVGAFLLTPFEMLLRSQLGGTYQGLYLLMYGAIMIVVILLIPRGIVGTLTEVVKNKRKKNADSIK
jgi:branched-chain amino acid transport system permease protein